MAGGGLLFLLLGVYRHSYDDNGNLSSTELPDGQALSYLYYGSGHLQQMNWRERGKQTVLAEYSRDRLHRETNRLSGGLDQRTEYDSSGRITAQIARLANSTRVTAATIDKRYTWDKHNNLTERSVSYGQADSPATQGHWHYETYRYDPLGQLTRRLNGFSEELFLYDEAANLLGHQRQVAFNNQVTTSEEYDYTYDGFGRMAQRRVRDSAVCQHYHYDAEHRITAVTFEHDPQGNQRAEYDYDILGRRTGKRVWQSAQAQRLKQSPENREPEETVQFCWNGLRLAGEKSSKSAHLTLHYVYNSGSYNPLARIESFDHPEKQSTDISYYHIALNGLPEEVTDSQGRIIWHGDYSLWGKLKREQHPVPGFRGQQNLRFQGQYFDRETGLHYNTFRYYAPDAGRFTQQDPIGLMGGLNLYQYAPNPLSYMDPLGLSCSFDTKSNRWRNNETGRFTTRPTDPSDLVNNGRINKADIDAWANQRGTPNTWGHDPAKFPGGGFKYDAGSYTVHGHGANPSAAAKFPNSNAASGPAASMKNTSTGEVFRTDGTWGAFKSDPNGAHILLDGSSY